MNCDDNIAQIYSQGDLESSDTENLQAFLRQ